MARLTDESKMPYGKHKGTKMADVPADYLMYCYDNNLMSTLVRLYVEEYYDAIQKELE